LQLLATSKCVCGPVGELTALPQPPAGFRGNREGEWKWLERERERKEKDRKRKKVRRGNGEWKLGGLRHRL